MITWLFYNEFWTALDWAMALMGDVYIATMLILVIRKGMESP